MAINVNITVIEGPDEGKTAEFSEGSLQVGRGRCDFVLTDKKTSGKHCVFAIEGNEVFIEDLQSTNGTYIGGRRVENRTPLRNLDEVIIGLSKISVAIVEKLPEVAPRTSSKTVARGGDDILSEVQFKSGKKSKKGSEKEKTELSQTRNLPPEDAVYRETGIQRIDDLIDDEMDAFSKWDDPAIENPEENASQIPRIKVNLILKKGPDGPTQFSCTDSVTTIGRKDVDIRLNDLDCSRKHAQLEIVGGTRVILKDLASTNGSFVNGKKVTEQEVHTGDLIQLGQTLLEVKIESA